MGASAGRTASWARASDETHLLEQSTLIQLRPVVVEMDPAGAREFGFDEALPQRTQRVTAANGPVEPLNGYAAGIELNFGCDAPFYAHFSADGTGESTADPLLPANVFGQARAAGRRRPRSVLCPGHHHRRRPGRGGALLGAQNFHYRINVLTRDALPS